MQVSYLYLIFICLHFAKITILSYLQDIRGLSLLSYLRYFLKVSSPTLNLCLFPFEFAAYPTRLSAVLHGGRGEERPAMAFHRPLRAQHPVRVGGG